MKEENINSEEEKVIDSSNTNEQTEENSEESIQEEKKELTPEEQIAQINDKYLRLYSEFENFRRRTSKEKLDIIKNANANLIESILPTLDDFDRAILANEKTEDPEALKEGFNLIRNKLKGNLEAKGLKEIESTGKDFDTEYHEAVTEFPAPSEDLKGKVIDTAEKGYLLNDKVIRYAKVVVGK